KMKVTILGAGAMGSALTIPLSDNGHTVNLWGTEYDAGILRVIRKRDAHPRIGVKIPDRVHFFDADQLRPALNGSDIVVIAVSSNAVRAITRRIAPYLKRNIILMIVSKGLEECSQGIIILTDVIRNELIKNLKDEITIVAVGGPSIASELAKKLPTAAVYASTELEAAKISRDTFVTPYYRIKISSDVIGLELSAALKNVYAIAIGWCDGLAKELGEKTLDNVKALLFTQALREMALIVKIMGGNVETVYDLAGVGDFEVTSMSKERRNRTFGELLGCGLSPERALSELEKTGRGVVEGYLTCDKAYKLAKELENRGEINLSEQLPLLKEMYLVLFNSKRVKDAISDFLRKI
ncbi:MAG TPA: glycerol-3-phosphate dehydrogenase, partial [Candidatus Bathyarchaeota archaeon]|nr:glycerol-3-phosphate dehydrogenase [Candidatus Bathyarchaeota archaeon]